MNKEVKSKKILHKVKKNWVVIGMTSVALLGASYVASQSSNLAPTRITAHADEAATQSTDSSSASTTSSAADNNISSDSQSNASNQSSQASSSTSQQSNESSQSSSSDNQTSSNDSNKSGDYTAPQSAVTASITNLGSQTTDVKKNSSINYNIALNNDDNLGRVIPKGTQIKINVNPQSPLNMSDVFAYSVYSKYSSQNNFDESVSGNTITLTTKKDFYPGTVNMNLSLVVKGPRYNWNGDTEEHETNPDPVNVTLSSTLQLPGGSEKTVNIDANQISVLPNTKSEDEKVTYNNTDTPGFVQPNITKNYPDNVKDYPRSHSDRNYVNTSNGYANYAPAYSNADGKPYFVAVAEFNKGNIPGFSGSRLSFTSGSDFDLNSLRLYASTDSDSYKDISNEPGVSFGVDSNGAVYADFSKSAYTKDFVDFVAYRPYSDLSSTYFVRGYGSFYKEGTEGEQSLPIGDLNYKIVPVKNDIGSSWVVAPNKTVYTQPDGTYSYNTNNLKDDVNVFKTVDGEPAGYEKVNDAVVNINNDSNINDGQTINVDQNSSRVIQLSYTSENAHTANATLTVVNPYVSVPSQNVTRNVTVNYVDVNTNKVLHTDSSSVQFTATGVRDTRDNSIIWGAWTPSNGTGQYDFKVPSIDGYVPEDSSDVKGLLNPLGEDVVRTVYMDPTEQVSESKTITVHVIPTDKSQQITETNSNGSYTGPKPMYDKGVSESYTFTRTNIKNTKTGAIVQYGAYTPATKVFTIKAPELEDYHLVNAKNAVRNRTVDPTTDGNDVYLFVPYEPDATTTVQRNVVDTLVIDHIDDSTKQKIAPRYEKDYTFVQTGTKNERTGAIKWNDSYSPDSYSYSVESPKIDGYELSDPNQLYVTGTIDGAYDITGTTVGYTKISTPSSSAAQSSSAEPSSSASQSSSAESSAQSSSAESSAQSSSAESSAQSSSAESSAQSSSAESSAQSSSAESSAQSSSSVPQSSSVPSSHGNNGGKPATSDKHEKTITPQHENNSTKSNANHERLPQTGDQTHENILVAIGAALIAMAVGLFMVAMRRKRK
ncbi:LPXTG cell wall anchor domain-containing protein [Apilactobacillus kunkeei]|uniref:mucin-binding protein n=1 Tax=Apilactobacillus kunkeei TaxID=148814 RepID=UPI00110D1583|nr:LPXTG cell wall anchor domain-containing protein [Apilactobacillus kunkeei]TMT01726.1 LPXTG cell wall anchor domain-containing protein [Apilactobacillus kunkeei]